MRDIGVTVVQTCALPIFVEEPAVGPGHLDRLVGRVIRVGEVGVQLPSPDLFYGGLRVGGRLPAEGRCGVGGRSEEGRVGEECRSRWSPGHYKKNKNKRYT